MTLLSALQLANKYNPFYQIPNFLNKITTGYSYNDAAVATGFYKNDIVTVGNTQQNVLTPTITGKAFTIALIAVGAFIAYKVIK
jgi:hypothetical protein